MDLKTNKAQLLLLRRVSPNSAFGRCFFPFDEAGFPTLAPGWETDMESIAEELFGVAPLWCRIPPSPPIGRDGASNIRTACKQALSVVGGQRQRRESRKLSAGQTSSTPAVSIC